jgi:hypothetical protein
VASRDSSILKVEVVCSSETLIDFNGLHGVISQKRVHFSEKYVCSEEKDSKR